jgi:hypothetical protein
MEDKDEPTRHRICSGSFAGGGNRAFADSVRPQSVMNQTGGYETTLKFFVHPAPLDWTQVAPSRFWGTVELSS